MPCVYHCLVAWPFFLFFFFFFFLCVCSRGGGGGAGAEGVAIKAAYSSGHISDVKFRHKKS